MTRRRLRLNPRVVALAAAVVLAAVAYVAARHHLETQERAAEARVAERHHRKPVLVARSDLPAGTILHADLLATRQVPARYVPANAALPPDLDRVEGQRLLHEARGGDPILWPSLAGGEHAALSASLGEGRRALTFPVDDVNALSGMLAPGDVIDLLYASPEAGGATVRPLLQRVTVLATGSTVRPRTGGMESAAAAPGAQFATITLNLTPEEAQLVVLAQRAGELTAVLRHPDDAGVQPARAVGIAALRGRAATARATRPDRSEYVDVITGGVRGLAARARMPVETDARPSLEPEAPAPASRAAPRSGVPPRPDAGDIRSRLGLEQPSAS